MEEARRGWRRRVGPCRERGDERKKRGKKRVQQESGSCKKGSGGNGQKRWRKEERNIKMVRTLEPEREAGQANEKPQKHMLGAPAGVSSSILAGRAGGHKGSLYMSERGGLRPEAYKKHRINVPASSCQGGLQRRQPGPGRFELSDELRKGMCQVVGLGSCSALLQLAMNAVFALFFSGI